MEENILIDVSSIDTPTMDHKTMVYFSTHTFSIEMVRVSE
jgi:hypothetical protein